VNLATVIGHHSRQPSKELRRATRGIECCRHARPWRSSRPARNGGSVFPIRK
jgi:hypothetical protein